VRIAVLLSAGLHPVSGLPVLPTLEAQAVRMALAHGEVVGVHAGPSSASVADAFGHGLARLIHVATGKDDDPASALAAALAEWRPDLVLAGRRGQGGDETGLVPYAVAAALKAPLAPDVVAIAPGDCEGEIALEQALPKGARRRLVVRLPAVVTIHPGAPAPQAFAYGMARRGVVTEAKGPLRPAPENACPVEERAYRRRPKLMRNAPAPGSAAERLATATGVADAGAGRLLVDPAPDEAARTILAYLREIGVLAPAPSGEAAPGAGSP
jgi:electron transfer flavoprotein beta subunit